MGRGLRFTVFKISSFATDVPRGSDEARAAKEELQCFSVDDRPAFFLFSFLRSIRGEAHWSA